MFVCFTSIIRASPLNAFLFYITHSLSASFGVSTVRVAEQSGHTNPCATESQERVCRGSRGQDRAHTPKTRDKSCSQKVHCTFLETQSSCQNEDKSSGSQVALGKGPWHFRVHKVRLQIPLSLHVDYASARARVAQGLQDDARLLCHLEARQGKECLAGITQPFWKVVCCQG